VIGSWERVLVLAPHTDDGEFGCGGSRSLGGANSNEEGGSWGKHGSPHANSTASVGLDI
jgi:hypothetical protein